MIQAAEDKTTTAPCMGGITKTENIHAAAPPAEKGGKDDCMQELNHNTSGNSETKSLCLKGWG